jgi:WD40 repeat protein
MSGSGDNTIKIWNYETYELIHTLEGNTGFVLALAHI